MGGAPHLLLDDESRPDATALLALAGEYGLSIRVLAPELHTVSVFYQQLERNGARKGIGLLYARPFC